MGESPSASPLSPDLYEATLDCVHCGLCLSSCPTYLETGRETSSPRGRIYLMRGVAEGRIDLGALVAEEAYLCLGCRACETACPSGVRYGELVEGTRAAVEQAGLRPGFAPRLERFALREIVPRPGRLRALVSLLGLAQWLRLDRLALALASRLPGAGSLGEALRDGHALLPTIPGRRERARLPETSAAEGERRGRVALFDGCVMREMLPHVNRATLHVLTHNGFDVVVPRDQGCCGALQAHSGDLATAHALARSNARVFEEAGVDAVVVNSAGCSAAMREAGRWLPGDGERSAALVRDVTEFLDEVGLRPPAGRLDARVCYDDPCHLVHGQRIAAAPRRVLEAIPGLELVSHDEAASCCGAAGIYNLTHGEMSRAVLDRKLDGLERADPDWIVSGNPGCLMQLAAGARRRGLRARVAHPVELLEAAYLSGTGRRPA